METIAEGRARRAREDAARDKAAAEDMQRKKEVNARLRKEAEDAQTARKTAPKVRQPEVEEKTTAPEISDEDQIKKTFRYLK
jgi:hypothetical protein